MLKCLLRVKLKDCGKKFRSYVSNWYNVLDVPVLLYITFYSAIVTTLLIVASELSFYPLADY